MRRVAAPLFVAFPLPFPTACQIGLIAGRNGSWAASAAVLVWCLVRGVRSVCVRCVRGVGWLFGGCCWGPPGPLPPAPLPRRGDYRRFAGGG